jgi:signal transduction histidine kinase/ActR/RegA family two-component response regulator/HAMP domain-containing protein
MSAATTPIRRRLMSMVLMTSGVVLLMSTGASLAYEFLTYRQSAIRSLATLGNVIADNSTAALAFANADDARGILAALKAEPHIVAAALYDRQGALFASYPESRSNQTGPAFPAHPEANGYRFLPGQLLGFQPVVENGRLLGTLYLESDTRAVSDELRLHGLIAALVFAASGLVAYLMSRTLQRQISQPILVLAEAARAVSDRRDYSVRAPGAGVHELGLLTEAFNHMLTQIQEQNGRLNSQLGSLQLLHHITRAIGERQDLASVFRVVLGSLEESLPIDFGCICLADGEILKVASVATASTALATRLQLAEESEVSVDGNGLSRCIKGELVYEPDVRALPLPFPQRLAEGGLRSLVIAPLAVENAVVGILIAARVKEDAFAGADCEFLRQLSEHVALAAHQAQLYTALQKAYEELRQSQQTVMQQERLRALGQMASGIAHDINNAISPVSLYTESLLEREPNLSDRARSSLTIIQRSIEDVAATVARMREFYRQREPQLELTRIDVNNILLQVVESTRARWSDLPQQRGVVVELQVETTTGSLEIMGAEGEIRDALTNLIFNAVDAMPDGGILTLRTRQSESQAQGDDAEPLSKVCLEVSDTGIGMDEETRRRCLEPFFTTKGERGTGLGLAMVYGMIQRHSAELELESTPGRGTTFRLVFLASTPDSPATTYRPVAAPAQRLRILLIDDDPMLIKSLQDALEGDGHLVTATHGGQAGIDSFSAAAKAGGRFDLVVTDLGMPHVDGRKVAAAIKSVSNHTPVIMLTGWGHRLIAEKDIPPHVDRVLSKPPRLQELRATLAELTSAALPAPVQEKEA